VAITVHVDSQEGSKGCVWESAVPLNYQRLMGFRLEPETFLLTPQATMLYALGVGFGYDPKYEGQLRFVQERRLQAAPTMAVIIGAARSWIHRDLGFGVTRTGMLHGEQSIELHRPLPSEGSITAETHVTEVVDKGAGKGGLVLSRTVLRDAAGGEPIATLSSTLFVVRTVASGRHQWRKIRLHRCYPFRTDRRTGCVTFPPSRRQPSSTACPVMITLCISILNSPALPGLRSPRCMEIAALASPAMRCCERAAITKRRSWKPCPAAFPRRRIRGKPSGPRSGALEATSSSAAPFPNATPW
jgi:N-terminal half of MaoC dehydratase